MSTKFNQNDEVSETSVERKLQIEIILRILRDALDKFRISLILPKIFENPMSVWQRLNGSKYGNCIKMIEEYTKEKSMDPANTTPPAHLNDGLIKTIDFFHKNTQVLDYFNDWLNDLRPYDKHLIEIFKYLLAVTEQRLNRTAISELNNEKKIHKIYKDNEKLKMNIEALWDLLQSEDINCNRNEGADDVLIQKYEKDLDKSRHKNDIMTKQEIIRLNRNLRQCHTASGAKQKELEEEIERINLTYERLLKENLKEEKKARDEKNKLLLQLQSLLKKFDQTMEDKFKESLDLQEIYEKEKELFDRFLTEEFSREEAEYERIVTAKEEKEKREREEKIFLFMTNRAARVIQKYWRKFMRARKKAAKKGKKKSGKTKYI